MYPQPFSGRERAWVEWILPEERAGYNAYRSRIETMMIVGEGRRGRGEIILGQAGTEVDFSSPLSPVFAYGAVETSSGSISVTLREIRDDQISVEIVGHHSDEVPVDFEEFRRWTYSTWSPGDVCPQCSQTTREVSMHAQSITNENFVLAICGKDRRLWVYEAVTGVNHLIPVTNFYNELMLHRNIRDPRIAFDSKLLFSELSSFSNDDFLHAFLTYNQLKTKVHLEGSVVAGAKGRRGFVQTLKNFFPRGYHERQ